MPAALAATSPDVSLKPPKLTPQQHNFAMHVAMGYSGAESYRRSYRTRPGTQPSSQAVEASKLMANPNVRQTVNDLKAQAAERAVVSRSSMLAEMEANRTVALDLNKVSAAETASFHRARVAGLLDRQPPGPPAPPADDASQMVEGEVTIEDRSANELARRIAFAMALGRRQAAKVIDATPAK